jgi:hypothetical protein
MADQFTRKAFLCFFLAVSAAAFAQPTHLLYHTGKKIAYPVRHPGNTGRGLWKLVKVVF